MTRSIGSAIVAELDDIYRNSIENLREAMRAYARDGSVPPAEAKTDRRFCYPELRIVHHGESEAPPPGRSEEHTSELQSLMRISYAVFCLKKKNHTNVITINRHPTNSNINHTITKI